jgi:phage tail sheath protein FI
MGVPTAIPGFVGYTQMAELSGRSVVREAIAIHSLAEFEAVFGTGARTIYELVLANLDEVNKGAYDIQIEAPDGAGWQHYRLTPIAATRFQLYDSIRLFYANGGGPCRVVSVGSYESPIAVQALLDGLAILGDSVGPTMLVVPDAVLLPPTDATSPWVSSDFATLAQAMLAQAQHLQDRVAILDVYGSDLVQSGTGTPSLDTVVAAFHAAVGDVGCSYGAAYFPFVHASVMSATELDFRNVAPLYAKDGPSLHQLLSWQNLALHQGTSLYDSLQGVIDELKDPPTDPAKITTLQNVLAAAFPLLGEIVGVLLDKQSVLPVSAAMAGIYTSNDTNVGVWNAPANVAVESVTSPSYALTDHEQGDLNVPVDGKAICAIRVFVNRGPLVWGARTLDGNSNDYRYIHIRRTVIYVQSSLQSALEGFLFAPNDSQTWATVVSMVSAFLSGLWSQGGLLGSTASDAFTVSCGLGNTMTGQDILEGYMIVQVTLQMIRPAEFIVLTFKQHMQGLP